MTEKFTDDEKKALRAQLRNGHRLAREEIVRRAAVDAIPTGAEAAKSSQVHSRACLIQTAAVCTCAVIVRSLHAEMIARFEGQPEMAGKA